MLSYPVTFPHLSKLCPLSPFDFLAFATPAADPSALVVAFMATWSRSTVMKGELDALVSAELLIPLADGSEWIMPKEESWSNPPPGHVVSFIHFHERGWRHRRTTSFVRCWNITAAGFIMSNPMESSNFRSLPRYAKPSLASSPTSCCGSISFRRSCSSAGWALAITSMDFPRTSGRSASTRRPRRPIQDGISGGSTSATTSFGHSWHSPSVSSRRRGLAGSMAQARRK